MLQFNIDIDITPIAIARLSVHARTGGPSTVHVLRLGDNHRPELFVFRANGIKRVHDVLPGTRHHRQATLKVNSNTCKLKLNYQ